MRVHPISINYSAQGLQYRANGRNYSCSENISANVIYNYLNALGNYNLSFAAKKDDSINNETNEKTDGMPIPIYAVDKDGNYTRYSSIKEASVALDTADSNISKCLKGKQNTVCRLGFLYANEIEKIGKNAELKINHKRIEKKRLEVEEFLSKLPVIRPFYSVDKDGNYIKFERNRDAAQALGVHHSRIVGCLKGERDTTGGYAFVYADEVESIDEFGNISVNIDIPKEKFGQRTPVPIYSISDKGWIRKYSSLGEAAKVLSIPRRNINSCVSGERELAGGLSFISAEDLEIKDKSGKVFINKAKLEEKFQLAIKHAVYVVESDGKFKRYASIQDAAKELGVSEATMLFCANGLQRGAKGCTVVKASYVETLDDIGKISLNNDLLKQFAKEAKELAPRPIIAIDENNHKQKFSDKVVAAQTLGIGERGIVRCLQGKQKTSGGYRFVYDDKTTRKTRAKEIIYALDNGGEVREFESIEKASVALGIPEEEIAYFLKRGRTPERKTKLNGYVFATSNDE